MAQEHHSRFGGDENPAWGQIAAMGHELEPGNAAYLSAAGSVAAMGGANVEGATQLGDDDFAAGDGSDAPTSSISRDFSAAEEVMEFDDDEVARIGDESLDPAFAFDESDLEATGDFSQISSELVSEDSESIDFPGFDATPDSTVTQEKPAATDNSVDTDLDIDHLDLSADVDLLVEEEELKDDLSLDGLDLSGDAPSRDDPLSGLDLNSMADDLTLDLEQLSGDMEIDSTELIDGLDGIDGLELGDLTSDNDPLEGVAGNVGDADEMDTMMDLAKAYIDMGDKDSASSALGEIVKSGSPSQVSEAETLLRNIS